MASSVSGQEESNPALWLATRAGKMELSCPLGTTRHVPQEKFPRKPYNKSFIDQACSVKMVGYWPRSFFASLWTSTPPQSINTQKTNLANIQPSWPHTWSITHTYLYCYFDGIHCCWIVRRHIAPNSVSKFLRLFKNVGNGLKKLVLMYRCLNWKSNLNQTLNWRVRNSSWKPIKTWLPWYFKSRGQKLKK